MTLDLPCLPPPLLPPVQPEATKRRMKNVMRFISVAIVPMTLDLPAAVFMYWTASNAFSLVQVSRLCQRPALPRLWCGC